MGFRIPLGRIFGIRVDTDPTVPVLAAIYTIALAGGRFPIRHPDLPTAVHWIAGIGGALLFLVSLLIHELAHALVARDEGIGVHGISLWFLGGMARLESSPETAAAEFRIAVVGPLSSAAWGVTLLCGSYLLGDTGVAGITADLFRLLGFVNLLLAGFNLIPAAPLDGGTVLSALVWRRTGSRVKGMRITALIGLAAGAILAWRGILMVREGDTGAINGWMFVIVGGFIAMAAFRTLRAAPLFELLEGVRIADSMEPLPPLAPGSRTVGEFVRSLPADDESPAFPVTDDHGLLAGLLTVEAIRAVDPSVRDHLRVTDLAFGLDRLTIVNTDTPVLTAVQRLEGGDLPQGVVVDPAGAVVGLITPRTLHRTVERRRAATFTT